MMVFSLLNNYNLIFFKRNYFMQDKLIELIAEALEIDKTEAENDLILDPEDNWDSIALLSVIASIDEEFNIQLDGDKLAECKSILEILKLLEENS